MSTLRPSDVRDVWEAILPGILAARTKGGGDWRPEDVYAACRNGSAHLWLSDESGAFCVLQLDRNSFTNELELLVWVAYSPGDYPLQAYLEQVRVIAREAGAVRARMFSTRKGWERVPGWEPAATEYVCEV